MATALKLDFKELNGSNSFEVLAQAIFSLDAGIQSVALEEAGRPPRWAWRDPDNSCPRLGGATRDAEFGDPLILTLAECHGKAEAGVPHQLRFVVLAYAESVQVLARLGTRGYISARVLTSTDACTLGNRIVALISRYSDR